jgi:hypothetical protein
MLGIYELYMLCMMCQLCFYLKKKKLFPSLASATTMTAHYANDCHIILGGATTLSHWSQWLDKAIMLGAVAQ